MGGALVSLLRDHYGTQSKGDKHGQTPLGTGITTLRKQTKIKIREYTNGHSKILF